MSSAVASVVEGARLPPDARTLAKTEYEEAKERYSDAERKFVEAQTVFRSANKRWENNGDAGKDRKLEALAENAKTLMNHAETLLRNAESDRDRSYNIFVALLRKRKAETQGSSGGPGSSSGGIVARGVPVPTTSGASGSSSSSVAAAAAAAAVAAAEVAPLSFPGRGRLKAANEDPNLRRMRLDGHRGHVPSQTNTHAKNCALCSYVERTAQGKRVRRGHQSTFKCARCDLYLCVRKAPGSELSCFDRWHSRQRLSRDGNDVVEASAEPKPAVPGLAEA